MCRLAEPLLSACVSAQALGNRAQEGREQDLKAKKAICQRSRLQDSKDLGTAGGQLTAIRGGGPTRGEGERAREPFAPCKPPRLTASRSRQQMWYRDGCMHALARGHSDACVYRIQGHVLHCSGSPWPNVPINNCSSGRPHSEGVTGKVVSWRSSRVVEGSSEAQPGAGAGAGASIVWWWSTLEFQLMMHGNMFNGTFRMLQRGRWGTCPPH